MKAVLIALVVFAALELNNCLITDSEVKPAKVKDVKYFIENPKSFNYKLQGRNGEHRYGVELKENKQFHHTKTEDDGVRLGCYGHMHEGKSYETHYVADAKGYRLVSPKDLITVYPINDGEPRKASFSKSFTEEEIKSANIRYFFPDGCGSGIVTIDKSPVVIEKKEEIIEIPVVILAPETTIVPETTILPETTTFVPETTTVVEEKCVQQQFVQCCDDDEARIVLSKNGTSKIVLPFDTLLLNRCTVEEIIEITSQQNNIELLKMLLKFARRYKL